MCLFLSTKYFFDDYFWQDTKSLSQVYVIIFPPFWIDLNFSVTTVGEMCACAYLLIYLFSHMI